MTKKKLLIISLFILFLLVVIFIYTILNPKAVGDEATNGFTINEIETVYENIKTKAKLPTQTQEQTEDPGPAVQIVATNLKIPWEIVFLPDNSLLVTQRPGTLLHILPNTQKAIEISGVEHVGEGGLLGMALHPKFETNKWIYLYFTTSTQNGLTNRIERYVYNQDTNTLLEKKIILENIPGAIYHDGGKIAFGPDGYLYITTGDAGNTNLAQDTSSLAGKILRLTDEGQIAPGNPFNNATFSYGHRNPQGLAWDSNSNLWSTEHGPSGVNTGYDEVNRITIGANYGWPTITGAKTQSGMVSPVIQSGSSDTWAPAGMVIVNDVIFFTGLRGESLYSAKISGGNLTNFTKHFTGEFGRLRALVLDPTKKWLYLTTSNTDGRGDVLENDDKIIKINIEVFNTLF